ncbi:MAG: tetratricopeptide repeat protein [Deltaproteobacteria bacterium]|nr:tetratricopeptide repeat protein [Deltaproteobacteria bacterium]
MTEWQKQRAALQDAVTRRDFDAAEPQLAELWRIARAVGTDELACHTHFQEGVLRDKQGRHADALVAFQAALALDAKVHGPKSGAVADTLHSIAIVQDHLGDLEASLATSRREAEVVSVAQKPRWASTLMSVGHKLLRLERLDEALKVMKEAVDVANTERLTPEHDKAAAHVALSEAYRRLKRWGEALSQVIAATQFARPKMWPELQDAVARAWFQLAFLSQHVFQSSKVQAAVGYWFATLLDAGPLRERARAALDQLPERELASGDPAAYRVVYLDTDKAIAHLACMDRGLFIHRQAIPGARLGQVVHVTRANGTIVSIDAQPTTSH